MVVCTVECQGNDVRDEPRLSLQMALRGRECSGLEIRFIDLYDGVEELAEEEHELTGETIRSSDDYVEALCKDLDKTYSLDPDVRMHNEEREKLIARKNSSETRYRQECSRHKMFVVLYGHLSAVPANTVISIWGLEERKSAGRSLVLSKRERDLRSLLESYL